MAQSLDESLGMKKSIHQWDVYICVIYIYIYTHTIYGTSNRVFMEFLKQPMTGGPHIVSIYIYIYIYVYLFNWQGETGKTFREVV